MRPSKLTMRKVPGPRHPSEPIIARVELKLPAAYPSLIRASSHLGFGVLSKELEGRPDCGDVPIHRHVDGKIHGADHITDMNTFKLHEYDLWFVSSSSPGIRGLLKNSEVIGTSARMYGFKDTSKAECDAQTLEFFHQASRRITP